MARTIRKHRKSLVCLIGVAAVVSSLMGISYAQWTEGLEVTANITTGRWILDYEEGSGDIYGKMACRQEGENWQITIKNEDSRIANDYNIEVFAKITLSNEGTTAYNLYLNDITANIEMSDGMSYKDQIEDVQFYRVANPNSNKINLEACGDWFLLEMGATETFYVRLYEAEQGKVISEDIIDSLVETCKVETTFDLNYALGLSQDARYRTEVKVVRTDFPIEVIPLQAEEAILEDLTSEMIPVPLPLPVDPILPEESKPEIVPLPLPVDPILPEESKPEIVPLPLPVDPILPEEALPTPLPVDPVLPEEVLPEVVPTPLPLEPVLPDKQEDNAISVSQPTLIQE